MNRDAIISLVVLVIAGIGIVVMAFMLRPVPARALECQEKPDGRSYWTYRIIDGDRCWYKGHRRLPKSRLHWPDEPKPKKLKGDPVFNQIRAEVPLDAVRWYVRPFDTADPIIPPLSLAVPDDDVWPTLSEFDKRWAGVSLK